MERLSRVTVGRVIARPRFPLACSCSSVPRSGHTQTKARGEPFGILHTSQRPRLESRVEKVRG